MPPLPSNLRRDLERAIVDARIAAEAGARSALHALTVGEAKAGAHLDAAGKALRNRLRAHGRQLGDTRDARTGAQTIERLVRAVAYEHWHRMLFARFLAENDLLIEPESGVAVSLADVEELAREQGVKPWPLAASYAQRMLPQIFRTDDPALAIDLPTEAQLKLESILEGLDAAVFTADDALGWTYQFWQSAEKDAVNNRVKSGEKITGETLPAVTQLFTEHYMVQFLLHNTIGAWHAGKVLTSRDREGADSEQALRDAVTLAPLGGYGFEYLRFVREAKEGEDLNEGTGPWRPAAGTYDGWPKTAAELRVLEPCCGSGHFLVAAFELLVRLRIAEEGLDTEAAIRAVLADNLFGLELDPRCTQIAAFNLAFAAWKLAGRPIDLPPLNIACSGLGPQSTKDEWLRMAERELEKEPSIAREPIRRGLIHMHELFSDAPELGSLIDPSGLPVEGFAADFETIKPLLDRILDAESGDDEAHERAVAACGMAAAAEILAGEFTLAITNVPYLARSKQAATLMAFGAECYDASKADLATMLLERGLRLGATTAIVSPQNWLFLTRYAPLRKRLFKNTSWHCAAVLGPGSFSSISGEVVKAALTIQSTCRPLHRHLITTFDVGHETSVDQKADGLASQRAISLLQETQLKNPDHRLVLAEGFGENLLKEVADTAGGLCTFDKPRFIWASWEVAWGQGWLPLHSVGGASSLDGEGSLVVRWEKAEGELKALVDAMKEDGYTSGIWCAGTQVWGQEGVLVRLLGDLPVALYRGLPFDNTTGVLIPKQPKDVPAVWEFCRSPEFRDLVRSIDKKMNVTNATLSKVPFNLDHWQKVAAEKYPNGLPEPQSDDPTQWLFHGRPERAEAHAALQVGVARLVGYRWPAELDETMRLAPEARALVNRCAELADHADDDGIVCLTPLRGEPGAADRLRRLLGAAFGKDWSNATEQSLLAAAAEYHKDRKPAASLDEWLREKFFEHHCKLFHHRPFVWHIWDGRKDGFSALVNYHKLAGPEGHGRKTLESVTYSYLGDWIRRQESGVKSGEAGAEARLAAAMTLKAELEKILAGEPPYDIFVRWKPLHEQPIGWEPDINDGVRLNIRPFLNAADVKGKGAGVLRCKPNVKWTKDRGKEPQSLRPREDFPWFWGWDEKTPDFTGGPEFDGSRWNDLHYTSDAKQAARERPREEAS